MVTISWSWTMPVAPQHKAQVIRSKEVLEVRRNQPNAVALLSKL